MKLILPAFVAVTLVGCGATPSPSTAATTKATPSAAPSSAPAATEDATPGLRSIEFKARDYGFPGLPGFTATVGEKVRFAMTNISNERQHDFQLFLPDGKELGTMDLVEPGGKGEVTLTLAVAGTYRFLCGVGNHEEKGQKGTFEVT